MKNSHEEMVTLLISDTNAVEREFYNEPFVTIRKREREQRETDRAAIDLAALRQWL